MHSLARLGFGIFFALIGIALFAFTMRKGTTRAVQPVKKSELRVRAAEQTEANKLRIAAAIFVAVGAALMVLS
jgi:hypothetical protein